MGEFEGHWIPSVAYSVLALWWGFVTSVRLARVQRYPNRSLVFESTSYMPFFFLGKRSLRLAPIESVVKIIGLGIHVTSEVANGFYLHNSYHFELKNAHHVCMMSGFILAAVVEILVSCRLPLPPKSTYAFSAFAFLIQVMIMFDHNSPGIESTLHKLWTQLIVLTALASFYEFFQPNDVWAVYLRTCFLLSQGYWLMTVAFVMFPHTDNPLLNWPDNENSKTWMKIFLVLHLLAALCTLMAQYLLVYCTIGFWDRLYSRYESDLTEKRIMFKVRMREVLNNEMSSALLKEQEFDKDEWT